MVDPVIVQLTAELSNLSSALRSMVNTTGRTAGAIEANNRRIEQAADDVATFSAELVKGRKLNADQKRLAEEAIRAKRKEIIASEQVARKNKEAADAINKYGPNSPEAIQAQKAANRAAQALSTRQMATADASTKVENTFHGLIKGTRVAQAAMIWFGSTVTTQAKQLVAQQKANGGLVEGTDNLVAGLLAQQNQALRLGLNGDELGRTVAANRQMINAMGTTKDSIDTLNPTIDRMRILTGSSAEATELAMTAAREFAEKGVRPTARGMQQYTNDLVQLSRQTGLNTQQASAYYNEIANDADTIQLLRQARDSERESILANQRALVQNSIAQGMSAQQAKEAAKMLNRMVAAKPLDRIRQAAKIRALGGAMGIAGSEEAAQAVIAGPRANAEQKANLAAFNTNATNAMDQSAQNGLGSEIFASTLLDKLNLGEQFGPSSSFSTTLGASLQPVAGAVERLTDSSRTSQGEIYGVAVRSLDQLSSIVSGNNWIGTLLSGIAVGVTSIATIMAMNKGKDLFKSTLGNGGKAAEGVRDAGKAAGAGKLAGASKVAGVVGKLGAVGAVAGGVYEGYDEYQQTGKMGASVGKGAGSAVGGGLGAWGGAAAGAALGSVIPVIGTVVGGVLGGILGGWGGSTLGGEAGKSLGGIADKPDVPPGLVEAQRAATTTAMGIDKQVKQMDNQNDMISSMRDAMLKQVEIGEKTLVALTLSDSEKRDKAKTANLRKDNKFASQYNYVG